MIKAFVWTFLLAAPFAHAETSPIIAPALEESFELISADIPRWTPVNLRIDLGTGAFFDIIESSLRISVQGTKDSGGYSHFSGTVDNQFISVTVRPVGGGGFNVWGSGVNLSLNPSGNGYRAWGSVDAKNFSLSLDRFGGGWSLWGQGGLNLNVSGWGRGLTVNGSVDMARFDKKSLAALGIALAAVNGVKAPAK